MQRDKEGAVKHSAPPKGKVMGKQKTGKVGCRTYETPEAKMPRRMDGSMGDSRTRVTAHSKSNPKMPR